MPLSPYDQAGRAGPGFVGEPRSAPCVPGLGRPVWLVLLPHAGSQCVRAAVRQVSVFGSPTWRFPHVGVDFRGVVLPAPRPSRRAVQNVLCELRVPGVRAGAGSTSLTQHHHTPEGGVATRWLHGLELETSQSWRSEVTRSGSVSTGSEQRSTLGDRQSDFTERPLPFRLLGPLTLHLVWRDLARWVVRNPETWPARSNRCLSRRAKTSCQSRSLCPSRLARVALPKPPGSQVEQVNFWMWSAGRKDGWLLQAGPETSHVHCPVFPLPMSWNTCDLETTCRRAQGPGGCGTAEIGERTESLPDPAEQRPAHRPWAVE